MRNFALTLSYDGSRYRGWQKQGNTDNTIQFKLEQLLSRLLEQPVELAGSGRTDAGVHAKAQVCSFKADTELDCDTLLRLIRQYLPEDIGAESLREAEPRFHARLSCREKTYVYSVWNSESPNVFGRKYMLQMPGALDLEAMRKAAELLLGEHDFSAFCSLKKLKKSPVRALSSIEISQEGALLQLRFTGSGFLYNMVRILSGTLLEVGMHSRSVSSVREALESRDRAKAGFTAPAHGLCLLEVRY